MSNILITGDRTLSPAYPLLVAVEMLRAVAQGDAIFTGDTERGVDALVQELGKLSGVEVTATDALGESASVVFIHVDPHTSSRIKPFLGDDTVRIVTMADLAS